MSTNTFTYIFTILLLISCASPAGKIKETLEKNSEVFNYNDKNGTFRVKTESFTNKKGKSYITKKSLETLNKQKENILEKSIVVSDIGTIKNIAILRPRRSQYTVWFDGKKYFSELNLNAEKKAIDVKMISPEKQWSGIKTIKFPTTRAIPCFFSQIIECADVSGFINMASKKEAGAMELLIVWEGFPYLNETFSDFPAELFSEGTLEYDGKTKDSERKFNLKVAGQSIVFVLNDKNKMTKMFWVTQGISMVGKSVEKNTSNDEEDPGFE